MNRLVLQLVSALSSLWEKLGADPVQLAAILEAKLAIDGRRPHFLSQGKPQNQYGFSGAMAIVVVFLFMLGLMMGSLFFVFDHLSTSLFLYLTVWMILLGMSIITDFTEVLLDERDNFIILSRPVNGKTIALARLIHITVYLIKLTAAFALPALVLFPIKAGIQGLPLFLVQLILSVFLVVLIINVFYLFLFRVIRPARMKDILGYFQIAATILIILGYFVVPRVLEFDQASGISIYDYRFFGLFPSVWIASLWDTFMEGELRIEALYYSGMALLMPALALFLFIGVFAPRFNQQLLQLSFQESSSTEEKAVSKKQKKTGGNFYYRWWLARLKQPEIRATFSMSWKISGRDRDFKLRTFPVFGLLPAYFLMFALMGDGTLAEKWARLMGSRSYLLLLYLSFLPGLALIQNVFFTKHPSRSWIFYAFPVESPGRLILGTILGVLAKYFFPLYLIMGILVLSLFGLRTLPDLLFALGAMFVALLGASHLQLRYLPFSRPAAEAQQGQAIGVAIVGAVLASFLGIIHYGITQVPWLYLPGFAIIGFSVWQVVKAYQLLDWGTIRKI